VAGRWAVWSVVAAVVFVLGLAPLRSSHDEWWHLKTGKWMVEENGRFLADTTRNISEGFYAGTVFFEHGEMKKEDILRRYKRAYKEFYSFRKKLKLFLRIRSLNELAWYCNSAKFVLKGMFKR